MTKENQKEVLAKLDGKSNLFVIMRRGLYYRPDAMGYTGRIEDAWHVTEDVADQYVYPHDEPVSKRRLDKFPDYLNSWDAIIPLIQKQPVAIQRMIYREAYSIDRERRYPHVNESVESLCEALLRALGLWEE
jgi:hypothetical protein